MRLRILSLVLAMLTIALLFSGCTEGKTDDPKITTVVSTDQAGDTTEDKYSSNLPPMDFEERTFLVLGYDGGALTQFNNIEIWRENLTGDVVGDAVFTRNATLKEKYNFIVKQDLRLSAQWEAQTLYMANEHVYDAVLYPCASMIQHAQQGFLLDLNDVPYINLEHASWDQKANSELTIKGRTFLANSDFLLQLKERTYFMMYNRELLHSHDKYNGVYIEDEYVNNGTWTIDTYYEIAKEYSEDLDGGGTGHIADQWALCADGFNVASCFAYGGGYRLGNNVDGEIVLADIDVKMLDVVDKSLKATIDPYLTLTSSSNLEGVTLRIGIDTFVDGRALFLSDLPSSFDIGLKNIEFEYGILPYPKYDEGQSSYYTMFNWDFAATCAIPFTAAESEFVGYCLQAITEESTKTTLEAYYETKCKLQNAYDQRCADMLDILFTTVSFDVAAIFDVGGLASILRSEIFNYYPANVFKRLYDRKVDTAQGAIDKIMADFS